MASSTLALGTKTVTFSGGFFVKQEGLRVPRSTRSVRERVRQIPPQREVGGDSRPRHQKQPPEKVVVFMFETGLFFQHLPADYDRNKEAAKEVISQVFHRIRYAKRQLLFIGMQKSVVQKLIVFPKHANDRGRADGENYREPKRKAGQFFYRARVAHINPSRPSDRGAAKNMQDDVELEKRTFLDVQDRKNMFQNKNHDPRQEGQSDSGITVKARFGHKNALYHTGLIISIENGMVIGL